MGNKGNIFLPAGIILALFSLLLLLTVTAYLGINSGQHLIGRWTFDNQKKGEVEDLSGHGNPGITENTTFIPGVRGQAIGLTFAYNSKVKIAKHTSLSLPSLSFQGWIYLNNYPADSAVIFQLLGVEGSKCQGWCSPLYIRINNDGKWALVRMNEWAVDGKRWDCSTANCIIPTQKWTFIAVSQEGAVSDKADFYINGELVYQLVAPAHWGDSGWNYPTVGLGGTMGEGLDGYLDEISIYDIAKDGLVFKLNYLQDLIWKRLANSPIPLTWNECLKTPNAKILQTYPEICTTPDGRKVVQSLAPTERVTPPVQTNKPEPCGVNDSCPQGYSCQDVPVCPDAGPGPVHCLAMYRGCVKNSDETVNWKTYSNDQLGFRVDYPSNITQTEDKPYWGEIKVIAFEKPDPKIANYQDRVMTIQVYDNSYKNISDFISSMPDLGGPGVVTSAGVDYTDGLLSGQAARIATWGAEGACSTAILSLHNKFAYRIDIGRPCDQKTFPIGSMEQRMINSFKFL